MGTRFGLCGGQYTCSLNCSFTVWAQWILALWCWNIAIREEKESIDRKTIEFIQVVSWLHYTALTLAESKPAATPDYNTAPTGLYSRYEAWWLHQSIHLSSYLIRPPLWNRGTVESSHHMTRLSFHCKVQSVCSFLSQITSLIRLHRLHSSSHCKYVNSLTFIVIT